jgi:hypothetical protein
MSDPFAGTNTRNLLQHIISPKIIGPTGAAYSVQTDLINIDTVKTAKIQAPVTFVTNNALTGYAGENNTSNSPASQIVLLSPLQLAQNSGPTGATPKYPCSYALYATSASAGGLTQDCFDIFAYPGGGYANIGTNDPRGQDSNGKWYTNPVQQGLRIQPNASNGATGGTLPGRGFNSAVCLTNPGFLDSGRNGTFPLPGNTASFTTPRIGTLTPYSKIVLYLISGVLTNTSAPNYIQSITEDMINGGGTISVTFAAVPSTNPLFYGYTVYG